MLKEFAVVSVPTLVISVADGQIESIFPTAELAQDYITTEKPKSPDRRYGIRERTRRNDNGVHASDIEPSALAKDISPNHS
jgi:hypothetical protein